VTSSPVPNDVLPANVSNTVATVVERYLGEIEASVPGLVEGVYLTGSVALGDFHARWSDVDFVSVCRERPTREAQGKLADVHERMAAKRARPVLDGWYLTWEDLASSPDRNRTLGLRAHEGVLRTGRNSVPPVLLWHELFDHGLHVWGPGLDEREIATDPDAVRAWCLDNLETYWTPWWHRNAKLLSASGIGALGSWAPTWGVLGVTRIHYTLSTGKITSKCGGGEWALDVVDPEWRQILRECLRTRNRPDKPSLYRTPLRRRRDMLTFMDLLMTDDEEVFTRSGPAGSPGS